MEEFTEFSTYMRSSIYSKMFVGVNLLAIVLGLIGNSIFFLCAFKLKRHNHFYTYIYYLIINDIMSCICHLFWPVATYMKGDMLTNYYIAALISKTFLMSEFTRFNVNWMNVIIVADRLVAIRKPFLYKKLTAKIYILILISTYTFVNFLSCIPYIYKIKFLKMIKEISVLGINPNVSSYNVTIYYSKGVDKPWNYPYDTFILYFMYVTPLALTLIGNLELYRAIKSKKKRIASQPELSNGNGEYANQYAESQCHARNLFRHPNPGERIVIPKRNNNNSNKFHKLIVAQNVCLIVSTLPFVIYSLVIRNFVTIKLLKPSERGPYLIILTLRYFYGFLEVYINIIFDPDLKNIIKSAFRSLTNICR
ncbi:unnamed protein product [Gordionus sp. m RMFG-2023]